MPLPIQTFAAFVSAIVPFCHQIPFLATLYSCLSDRKSFFDNPFISPYRLYRRLGLLCPFALQVFCKVSIFCLKVREETFPLSLILVDTTLLRRNGTKLPFLKKAYDPLGKRGAVG
ncbi:MAG: hypothetical protein ACK4I8_12090, partial [Armatimonadota bacterium]